MQQAAKLAEEVSARDPAAGVRAVAALRRLLEKLEALHVRNARRQGS